MKIGFSSARTFTSVAERDLVRAVLFLERLHLAAGLDHDHGQRPAIELGAALANRFDEAVGLVESNHRISVLVGRADRSARSLPFLTAAERMLLAACERGRPQRCWVYTRLQ